MTVRRLEVASPGHGSVSAITQYVRMASEQEQSGIGQRSVPEYLPSN